MAYIPWWQRMSPPTFAERFELGGLAGRVKFNTGQLVKPSTTGIRPGYGGTGSGGHHTGVGTKSIYYKPLDATKRNKVPALVWVHGGPGGQSSQAPHGVTSSSSSSGGGGGGGKIPVPQD